MEQPVHFIGGPLDGALHLQETTSHPFGIFTSTDNNGFYALEYQVAGQRIGDLTLTGDDIIARWRQRSSPEDFIVGDTVVVKDTGARATVVGPLTVCYEDGTTTDLWIIDCEGQRISVTPDQIRLPTADELNND
jgi:hypothetical protein